MPILKKFTFSKGNFEKDGLPKKYNNESHRFLVNSWRVGETPKDHLHEGSKCQSNHHDMCITLHVWGIPCS